MSDPNQTDQPQSSQPDQPGSSQPADQPQIGVPGVSKETETQRISQFWRATKEARQEDRARPVEPDGDGKEQEAGGDLMEILPPPEEQAVEITPEMAELGITAVPPVIAPQTMAAADDQALVILPLTEEEVEEGLHHKVSDSIRWLAEWCLRLIKIAHGRVRYAKKS